MYLPHSTGRQKTSMLHNEPHKLKLDPNLVLSGVQAGSMATNINP
jgi:hypothetical protein